MLQTNKSRGGTAPTRRLSHGAVFLSPSRQAPLHTCDDLLAQNAAGPVAQLKHTQIFDLVSNGVGVRLCGVLFCSIIFLNFIHLEVPFGTTSLPLCDVQLHNKPIIASVSRNSCFNAVSRINGGINEWSTRWGQPACTKQWFCARKRAP